MTISRSKFEAIVQELADDTDILCDEARSFAHALIKRVEAECFKAEGFCGDGEVVTALPLVGE